MSKPFYMGLLGSQKWREPFSPIDDRRKGRLIEMAIRALTAQLGYPPSDMQIAKELGLDLPAYQGLLSGLKSLNLGVLRSNTQTDSTEEQLMYFSGRREDDLRLCRSKKEMKEMITHAIGDLRQPERLFITLYYYEDLSIQEIGLILNMPESSVWQLRASSMLHLRAKLVGLAA